MNDIPEYMPDELRNIEPVKCRSCRLRIWYQRGGHLILHEAPTCQDFINIMHQMNGIPLNLNNPKS